MVVKNGLSRMREDSHVRFFWGYRSRGRCLPDYTLLGSVFMLLAILLIWFQTGSTDLQILFTTEFSERRQILLWVAFFASFAVKVPMIPVHIWLPEAHVEAPTAGSVILAGVLLKMGTYGFLRFSIPMFPEASLYFTPFILTLSVIAICYTSLTTIRQIDLKKIIAYSSVAHMNFVTIGLFSRATVPITLSYVPWNTRDLPRAWHSTNPNRALVGDHSMLKRVALYACCWRRQYGRALETARHDRLLVRSFGCTRPEWSVCTVRAL